MPFCNDRVEVGDQGLAETRRQEGERGDDLGDEKLSIKIYPSPTLAERVFVSIECM